MYQLIYLFIVKLVEKRNPDAKFYSAGVVLFTQVVHTGLIFTIFQKVFNVHYPVFSTSYLINKLLMMPILLIWIIIVHFYYKSRFLKIEKFYDGKPVVTFRNAVIVFSLILVPLFFIIFLLKK
jgi:hypothetical protein